MNTVKEIQDQLLHGAIKEAALNNAKELLENTSPMNTEQLKTDAQKLLRDKYGILSDEPERIVELCDFASQESKIAVSEFKEKLKAEILSMRNNRHAATASWTLQEAIDLIDKL